MYRASEIKQSLSAQIGSFTVIGKGTSIGHNSNISNSCSGEGCVIGSNVSIVGSYIWDNVTIEDGCELRHAIVCNVVIIKPGAVLEPGVVLSFKVVIGQQFVVPAYSKVSLLQEPTMEDTDEELEYADNSSGTVDASTVDNLNGEMTSESSQTQKWPDSELGAGWIGYIWSIGEGSLDGEWRHSVAPVPANKLAELRQAIEDDVELLHLDSSALPPSNITGSDDHSGDFENEVYETFLRAFGQNFHLTDIIFDLNSLRLTHRMASADCVGPLFYSMMKVAIETSHANAGELFNNVSSVIDQWKQLLQCYVKETDEQAFHSDAIRHCR